MQTSYVDTLYGYLIQIYNPPHPNECAKRKFRGLNYTSNFFILTNTYFFQSFLLLFWSCYSTFTTINFPAILRLFSLKMGVEHMLKKELMKEAEPLSEKSFTTVSLFF